MGPDVVNGWAKAAEQGGPWFLVVCLCALIYFGGKWLYNRGEGRESTQATMVLSLQKEAITREKAAADSRASALKEQADMHEERYEALREEGRAAQERRNEEIKEIAVQMTTALHQYAAASHLNAKAIDELRAAITHIGEQLHNLETDS
jgi:hypothetical protein